MTELLSALTVAQQITLMLIFASLYPVIHTSVSRATELLNKKSIMLPASASTCSLAALRQVDKENDKWLRALYLDCTVLLFAKRVILFVLMIKVFLVLWPNMNHYYHIAPYVISLVAFYNLKRKIDDIA